MAQMCTILFSCSIYSCLCKNIIKLNAIILDKLARHKMNSLTCQIVKGREIISSSKALSLPTQLTKDVAKPLANLRVHIKVGQLSMTQLYHILYWSNRLTTSSRR